MSEVFDGTVEVQDAASQTTVMLDGNAGDISAGGNGQGGEIALMNAAGGQRIRIDGETGNVQILDAAGDPVFEVMGNSGDVIVWRKIAGVNRQILTFGASAASLQLGSQGSDGDLVVRNTAGEDTVVVDGQQGDVTIRRNIGGTMRDVMRFDASHAALYLGSKDNEGDLIIRNSAGDNTVHIDGGQGDLFIRRRYSRRTIRDVLRFDASHAALYVGAKDNEGDIIVRDQAGKDAFHLNGSNAALYVGTNNNEGDVVVRDNSARDVIHLNGSNAAIYVGAKGNEGDIVIRDDAGRDVFHLDGGHAALYIGAAGNEGDIRVRDAAGRDVFNFNAEFAVLDLGAQGNEGDLRVRDNDGDVRIHLDGGSGDIKLLGADCAEDFDVAGADSVEEGTVLVIDDEGALRESSSAYDRRVAGVVSGAGGYRPGIVLDKQGDTAGRKPVALMGKVFCKVDATRGPVAVGDLLTTSETPGHAMRADDPLQAFGAVIGKALAPLAGGRGLVPILVALQ